jgi:hypothetical protein
MTRTDPTVFRRRAPSALVLLGLPVFALGWVGRLPAPWLIVLPALAASVPVLLGWLKVPSPDLALLAPLGVLGLLIGLGAPGATAEPFAVMAAIGILFWLAVTTHPRRKFMDLAAGVVVPAFGGTVALALSFLAPAGFAFVGAAATLAAFGFVVVAVIVWMASGPGPSASAS